MTSKAVSLDYDSSAAPATTTSTMEKSCSRIAKEMMSSSALTSRGAHLELCCPHTAHSTQKHWRSWQECDSLPTAPWPVTHTIGNFCRSASSPSPERSLCFHLVPNGSRFQPATMSF